MNDDKPIIKATTPNSDKYDTKVDVYTSDPRGEHESIHVAIDSDTKSAHIIDTTNGSTEHTDVSCFLTTSCMRVLNDHFDDNCYELITLRWFRDMFVSKEDINHYYEIAPIIVEEINKQENSNLIYKNIYDNVVYYCVKEIENGDYTGAYSRYKNSILAYEEELVRPALEKRLIKVLKLMK